MKIQEMTPAQRRAVETKHANVFAIAGPGSGKTTVLAHRINRIIDDGCHPNRIVAITYTNAAARNLEQRISPFLSTEKIGQPYPLGFAGTLHGFCLRMLREHGEAAGYGPKTGVLDEESANELLHAKMLTTGCRESLEKVIELKAKGRPTRVVGGVYTKAQLAILSYMDELAESALLDFDMILTEFVRILIKQGALWQAVKDGFDHVLFDEVQDFAEIDWIICTVLPIANKFLVGDPDQAIFGFRGGRVDFCVRHAARQDVEVINLDLNFRCCAEICNAANRLIGHNSGRVNKLTFPARIFPDGQCEVLFSPAPNEAEEIRTVVDAINYYYTDSDGTTAVLARTNAIAASFREALERTGMEVEHAPESAMPDDWSLARALLEFLAQPNNDTLAFFYLIARDQIKGGLSAAQARKNANDHRVNARTEGKTINALWFGIGEPITDGNNAWVAQTAGHFADKEHLSRQSCLLIAEMAGNLPANATMLDLALEAASRDKPADPKPSAGVTVTTIHAAKGREWDVVYLVGMEDEVIPGNRKSATAADIEEDRRLFFVALTRSRGDVWITHSATRRAQWGPQPLQDHKPSRFIEEALT